jgi:hypothetical protein
MVATERVKQGPQRDNYLAWGLFQVPPLFLSMKRLSDKGFISMFCIRIRIDFVRLGPDPDP